MRRRQGISTCPAVPLQPPTLRGPHRLAPLTPPNAPAERRGQALRGKLRHGVQAVGVVVVAGGSLRHAPREWEVVRRRRGGGASNTHIHIRVGQVALLAVPPHTCGT